MNLTNGQMDEESTSEQIFLLSVYAVIFSIGIATNSFLLFYVACQYDFKNKNPLLLTLIAFDLLVCVSSAPLAAYHSLYDEDHWIFPVSWCKIRYYIQVVPTTGSTLSMMTLSIERCVNVLMPQPIEKCHKRRLIATISALACWFLSFVVNIPILVLRQVVEEDNAIRCMEVWHSAKFKMGFVITNVIVLYSIPFFIVIACHIGLREKLADLPMPSRTGEGEVPFSLPLLRPSSELPIMVIGLSARAENKVVTYHRLPGCGNVDKATEISLTEEEEETSFSTPSPQRRLNTQLAVQTKTPGSADKKPHRNDKVIPKDNIRKPQNGPNIQSDKNKGQMADALIGTGVISIICWLPYIIYTLMAVIYDNEFEPAMKSFEKFSLLIGHFHSLLNPLLYIAMNYKSVFQMNWSTCFFIRKKTVNNQPSANKAVHELEHACTNSTQTAATPMICSA